MKLTGSSKARFRRIRRSILQQMDEEQETQTSLRSTIMTSKDEEEVIRAKRLFDESAEHWKVLAYSLEEYGKLSKSNWNINPDTLLVVGGNLVGILLILNFERMDIIRSKAISFVLKGRV